MGKLQAKRRDSKTKKSKVGQITKEQREELLEQGRKEGKEDFSENHRYFRYPEQPCHLKNVLPLPTVCAFMV